MLVHDVLHLLLAQDYVEHDQDDGDILGEEDHPLHCVGVLDRLIREMKAISTVLLHNPKEEEPWKTIFLLL